MKSHDRNVTLNASGTFQFRFGSGNEFKQSGKAEGRVSWWRKRSSQTGFESVSTYPVGPVSYVHSNIDIFSYYYSSISMC